jgi:phosphotriesterase-related protein
MIRTVRGDIAPESLGFCQSHEHLCITKGRPAQVNPDLCIDDPDKSARELTRYREAGGQAVVDAQPVGCGRDPLMLETLSRTSGVHIIASTGFHRLCFTPKTTGSAAPVKMC